MSRAEGPLLAFDFGLKRIGVATGNRLTRTASPLTTLVAAGRPPWREIDALVAEWQPARIVVGNPGPDGNASLLAALEAFLAELAGRYALPVETVDERFSSADAESRLRAGRAKGIYNRRLKKDQIDRHAACLIAEQWMQQALERD
jgi:putative pre-16S rRNA nuclease